MFRVILKANKDMYVWELSSYADIISLVEQYKSVTLDVYQLDGNLFEKTGEKNKDFWKYMMTISK